MYFHQVRLPLQLVRLQVLLFQRLFGIHDVAAIGMAGSALLVENLLPLAPLRLSFFLGRPGRRKRGNSSSTVTVAIIFFFISFPPFIDMRLFSLLESLQNVLGNRLCFLIGNAFLVENVSFPDPACAFSR